MDEILRGPIEYDRPLSVPETRSLHLPQLGGVGRRLRGLSLPNFLEQRSSLDPAIFLTLALSIGASAILGTNYVPAVTASVDGVELGIVESRQALEGAVERVEARASSILGYDYTLDQEVDFSYTLSHRDDVGSVSPVESYLFSHIGEVMQTTVLTVNGELIGAADDEGALYTLLDSIKAPYMTANTISAEFVEPVVLAREYVSTDGLKSVSSMKSLLTSNSLEQVDYIVQEGDTFSQIAYDHGMRQGELQALNPGINIDRLKIGQELLISRSVPYLSVRTVDNLTYEGAVPYEVEEIPDDTMYEGNSTVVVKGVEGSAIYNADVTYINGVEESRIIHSTEVLAEPVTQVVRVGTKERPRTMATGSFRWPVSGTITSGYGYRYIFGSYSYHSGIDIATGYGTPIAAADGGKVIFSGTGTGSFWSYGKYVVIDHENGLKTIYAHCSSLDVQTGDRVYKGQTIARVGSTGQSTGNHCHFQVKQNNVTVNPYNYLP